VTIRIREATRADFEATKKHPSPLTFDFDFVERLSAATGFRNVSILLETDDSRHFVPVLRRRAFSLYPLDFSLPFGLHGSIHPTPSGASQFRALLLAAQRHLGTSLVLQNWTQDPGLAESFPAVAALTTHVIPTRGTTYEALAEKHLSTRLRKRIRRGEKDLELEVGNDVRLIRAFYDLYLLSNARWGKKKVKYSLGFFEAFAGAPFFEIRVVSYEGKPVAAIVVVKSRDEHLWWFGAMDTSPGDLHANQVLISSALKAAVADGVAVFNFGASGNLAGVKKFKESFSAEPHEYPVVFVGNPVVETALRRMMRETE
jgi:hypothetical protein